MIQLTKRAAVTALLAAGLAACNRDAAPAGAVSGEMSLGSADAPVTVVEYASVACPVCGAWQREVFPQFKAKYIDTNKVRLITREMLVGDKLERSIAASGFLLARCAGKDKYFAVTDAIYHNQQELFQDPRGGLLRIAQSMGMSERAFETCINDRDALRALNERVEANIKRDDVNATPTFVVGGKKMEPGFQPLEALDAAIAAAQKK